jgi:hypothetical protein
MPDPVEPLILDLLEWIGTRPRPYAEVLEAWRTSCPRLPVWEEANERGYIDHLHQPGQAALVAVSASGLAYLRRQRAAGARDGPETIAHCASIAG